MNEKKSNDKRKFRKKINIDAYTSQYIYMVIIVILFIYILFVSPKGWFISVPLSLIVIGFIAAITINEFFNRTARIGEIEKSANKMMKKLFDRMELPIMILNKKNEMIWSNKKFSFIVTPEDLEKVLLQIDSKTKNDNYTINLYESEYEVYQNTFLIENENFKLLCFIDKTEEKNMKTSIVDNKLCLGLVVVDNFEEVLQGLDEMDRVNVISRIDKEIRKWGKNIGAVVAKFEKDRYMILLTKKELETLKKKQFEILSKIKNITDLTKVPVSLSIGISNDEESLYERYKSTVATLDIALGRGGDQTVVKENGKYGFYGDAAIKVEKMSKVRSRTIAQATKELIEKADSVYVMGHKNTDIDCIGAAIGFCKIAEKLNTPIHIIVDAKYNSSSQMIMERIKKDKKYENVFITKDDIKKQDFNNSLLIIVDTHKKSYLAVPEVLEEFEKVILVDHHRRGPEFIEDTILSYHEVYASSTSELVTELLMYIPDIELSQSEAEAMYAGILVDTKNFTFKTGVRTFEAAAYLKRVGLDIAEVKQIFQNNFETYTAKVEIVKKAEFIRKEIAISICDKTMDNLAVIAAQAADELLSISEVLASFVLCKIDGVVMISGRSMGDINVQMILERLGGGGHLTFAGAQLAGVELEEAKEMLIQAIDTYYSKDN
ncbi:MAG: DHH family phosphoesterase [Clostridia bacterium]